jgi:hypothetical protein
MFTDEPRRTVWDQIRQHDLRVFTKFLPVGLMTDVARQGGAALGGGPLYLVNLVWLGAASALHTSKNFADILVLTLKLLDDAGTLPATELTAAKRRARGRRPSRRRAKHDPRRNDPTCVTEEAFVQARQRMPAWYWEALLWAMSQQFEARHESLVRWKHYRLLALDGTGINLPNWKPLTQHFGTSANGRHRCGPQARMVMLTFPQVRLPVRYVLSPLHTGERTLAHQLLDGLQPNDLILMDRGFWSYGLFWQIQQQQAFFAIRLVKGVRVRTLRRLGRKDRVVRWVPADRKWRKANLPPSIDLRVIDYQIKGFRPSAVVTSVLDPQRISRDEWVRMATTDQAGRTVDPGLYHRRWEIETTFCELKVRQGMEKSLRSRTPESIRYEIGGHVLFYHLVRRLMVEAAVREGLDPLRLSFLSAIREVCDIYPFLLSATPERVRRILLPRLLSRFAQHRVPLRPGRHYVRPGDTRIKYKGKGKYQLPSKLVPNQA